MITNCLAVLIAAMITIESNGDEKAIGDNGRAWGCLQIRAVVIKDVNKVYGLHYNREDAFDPKKAREICRMYLLHWGNKINNCTPGSYARIWNGGPKGNRKPGTVAYWKKVKEYYNSAICDAGRGSKPECETAAGRQPTKSPVAVVQSVPVRNAVFSERKSGRSEPAREEIQAYSRSIASDIGCIPYREVQPGQL
jgi:hypothetical protein